MRNRQVGPDDAADILADVVARTTYKPGWTFRLEEISRGQGCEGLTLMIGARVPNSTGEGEVEVLHLMPVLPAAYKREAWVRWVFEQIRLVELHESLEWFKVNGTAPYFADHGPGRNPYAICEIKPESQPQEQATPWVGGPPQDPHFRADD